MDNLILETMQGKASRFLQHCYLKINGVCVYPKEIEAYYYEPGKFEDYSVHRNQLQGSVEHKNKFYVHRYGHDKSSKYVDGNRGGCDFVVCNREGVFYSYLIRSVVVKGDFFVGPRKSLDAIMTCCGIGSYEELENVQVDAVDYENNCDVLFGKRIRLGVASCTEDEKYKEADLRFVLCDEFFKKRDKHNVGYPQRTDIMDAFLQKKLNGGEMTKEEATYYSITWYGAVSKWLKEYK